MKMIKFVVFSVSIVLVAVAINGCGQEKGKVSEDAQKVEEAIVKDAQKVEKNINESNEKSRTFKCCEKH